MIMNDRQYKIAKSQIQDFQKALDELSYSNSEFKDVHPKILDAHKEAIKSKMQDLIHEAIEYENLKEGNTVIAEISDLADLPLLIIKSRIANKLTQAELAEKLGLKEQQIQKYEAERYGSASLKTLLKIAGVLGLKFNGDAQIKQLNADELYNPKNYPFKQMYNRGWFQSFADNLNEATKQSTRLISELYESAGISNLSYTFNRISLRTGSTVNKYALQAWYARVIIEAKKIIVPISFRNDMVTSEWITNLTRLSNKANGPLLARQYLIESGIRIVVEPQLEGTHLDGAALLLDQRHPVIAITLRYDRLDNFWFVLLHELAHVVLHLGRDQLNGVFDDLDVDTDGIEKEADDFALNALIPNEIWRKSLVRFSPSNKTIINQSESLGVSPALIAGRLRRETGKYHLFNDLIGQGEVRAQFYSNLTN